MTQKEKVKRFREIVTNMADLYEKKNSNYGDSFGKLYGDLGPVAGLVPLHNKLDRATSLVQGEKNNFESLEDTFKDLACYASMNLIEMEAEKSKYNTLAIRVDDISSEDLTLKLVDNYEKLPEYNWYKLNDISGGSITYTNPCQHCSRKHTINGCDGCVHNIQFTCVSGSVTTKSNDNRKDSLCTTTITGEVTHG